MPPPLNDWRTAYLRQARADFAVFNLLVKEASTPLCHQLHYLQMTTEKLSKGLLTPPGAPAHPRTHKVFVNFMRVAKSRADVKQACGFTSTRAFHAYVDSLLPLAVEIENLSPEGSEHPNPEYPWDDGIGQPISPLDYAFPGLQFAQNPKLSRLLRFLANCFTLV